MSTPGIKERIGTVGNQVSLSLSPRPSPSPPSFLEVGVLFKGL